MSQFEQHSWKFSSPNFGLYDWFSTLRIFFCKVLTLHQSMKVSCHTSILWSARWFIESIFVPPSKKHDEIMRIREDLQSPGCASCHQSNQRAHTLTATVSLPLRVQNSWWGLAVCLQYYIQDQMNINPAWQNISVSLLMGNLLKANFV